MQRDIDSISDKIYQRTTTAPSSFFFPTCDWEVDWKGEMETEKRRKENRGYRNTESERKRFHYSHLTQDPYLLQGRRRWRIHGNACVPQSNKLKEETRKRHLESQNIAPTDIYLCWKEICLITHNAQSLAEIQWVWNESLHNIAPHRASLQPSFKIK